MHPVAFQVGGGLPPDAPTYITRAVDADFVNTVRAGEYCYVLNARQMGKSSLRNRGMMELRALGVTCAAIDVSVLAEDKDSVEVWCAGLIERINATYRLLDDDELRHWWERRSAGAMPTSPIRRLDDFIENVLLAKRTGPCVLFLDEIDSVLGTDFGQALFALVRSMHDRRSHAPAFGRLTIVLIGVASPDELMPDARRSPFNIGRPIGLRGFSYAEAAPVLGPILATRFANHDAVLRAILVETGGQPFLTQKLSEIVMTAAEAIAPGDEERWVRQVVEQHVTRNWEAQDEPPHLRTIRDRLLFEKQRVVRRLDLLAELHDTKLVPFDGSREQLELRLSGVAGDRGGALVIVNAIYRAVFTPAWIAKRLEEVRPYAAVLAAWVQSDRRDESVLLRGQELADARKWAEGRTLSHADYDFLDSSSALETSIAEAALATERQANVVLKDARAKAERRVAIGSVVLVLTLIGAGVTMFRLTREARATEAARLAAITAIQDREAAAAQRSDEDRRRALDAQAEAVAKQKLAEAAVLRSITARAQLELAQQQAREAEAKAETQTILAAEKDAASRLQESRANALKLVDVANRHWLASPLLATRLLIEALMAAQKDDEVTRAPIRTRLREIASMGRVEAFSAEPPDAPIETLGHLGLFVVRGSTTPGVVRRIDDGRVVATLPHPVVRVSTLRNADSNPIADYFLIGYAGSAPSELRRGRPATLIASDVKSIDCPSLDLFCVTYTTGKSELRRTSDGEVLDSLPQQPSGFVASPDAPFVIINFDKIPSQLRRPTGELVEILPLPQAQRIDVSADRSLFAIEYRASQDFSEIWELRTSATGKPIPLPARAEWLRFGPAAAQVAVGYRDRPIELRVPGGRMIPLAGRIAGRSYQVTDRIVFNATGSTVVVAYDDVPGEIRDANGAIRVRLDGKLSRVLLSADKTVFGLEYAAIPKPPPPPARESRGRRSRNAPVPPPPPPPFLSGDDDPPQEVAPVEVRDAGNGGQLYRTEGAKIRFYGPASMLLVRETERALLYDGRRREAIPLPPQLSDVSQHDSGIFFLLSQPAEGQARAFRADTGKEIPVPDGWKTSTFGGPRFVVSADRKRYVTPWGEIRDGDNDAVLARTASADTASFNARSTAVVVCSGLFREQTCELRRASDGGLVRQFEIGLEFHSWAPSGELLFLRSSTRGGGLYDGASGALLGPGEGVTYVERDLAIVFLPNRSSDVWSTSPPRRLSTFEGQVGTSAYSTASDRVLLWPQSRGSALIVDVGWARRDPPDGDETALVQWACEPLRGSEFASDDLLKKYLQGRDPSSACMVMR